MKAYRGIRRGLGSMERYEGMLRGIEVHQGVRMHMDEYEGL